MSQPTQFLPSVCKTRENDTPLQASSDNPFGGGLSKPVPGAVEYPSDRVRHSRSTTTAHPRAHLCPNPPRGLAMLRNLVLNTPEGRPETGISVTPLSA